MTNWFYIQVGEWLNSAGMRIMKANSNNHPGTFTYAHGKLFFNSNIVESVKTEEDGSTRKVFDYEYVEVPTECKGNVPRDLTFIPQGIASLKITSASDPAWTPGALDTWTSLRDLTIDGVHWSPEEINTLFASLVACQASGNQSMVIAIINMPRPTNQGLTDAVITLPNRGCTVTIPAL